MVVEWLKFRVPRAEQQRFLSIDEAVWTEGLAQMPGFLDKEVWLHPQADEVLFIIRWSNREDWKAIPSEVLARLEAEFQAQLGQTYPLIEAQEYLLRAPDEPV
jgi:uncharacterized protein (TIGR03792 family)